MSVAILIGVPVGWALGISAIGSILLMGVPLSTVPQKIFSGMDVFPLMCIPFFILAGEIMAKGGLTQRLLKFAVIVVGFIRGGLALANVLASMIFGGITGSAVADASAVGAVEIPMMVENGYSRGFSAAITGASACIGPIIPPSIPVVIYAMAVSGATIGGLFAAGMIPGILVGLALMVAAYAISVKRNYPKRKGKLTIKELAIGFKDAFLALMMPGIILGGIISGIFTPTEAASISVAYAFLVTFLIYRSISLSDLPQIFLNTGVVSAIVIIIIGASNLFGMVIAFEQLALKLGDIIEPLGYVSFILTVNIILLIVGTFLDLAPAILILAPIFAPIAHNLGIHPLHFGTIVVVNLVIGMITPPLGLILFVVAPIAKVSIEKVTKEIIPFLLVEIGVLFLISYIPIVSLLIPRLFGFAP
ncbi:TRAP transporter large permease [Thermodesulfobacteriota bacterium]